MVGLSIVLEGHNKTDDNKNKYNYVKSSTTPINNPKATLPPTPPLLLQVINKTNKIINTKTKPSSSSSSSSSYNYCYSSSPLPAINFLDSCYLCQKPLLLNKDIFMYRGDRAFCSEECRCRHICMDDEESLMRREKCSMLATMRTSSSSASASRASHRKANTTTNKNTRAGGFAY